MRFLEIIRKEISLIQSQKMAVIIILLYPLLAILLLGVGLTGDPTVLTSMNVGVFSDLPHELDIVEELGQSRLKLNITEFHDEESLIDAVKKKRVMVGLRLRAFDEWSRINVDLYYDNSNVMVGSTVREFAKIIMNSFAIDHTRGYLVEIFNVFSDLGKNISGELSQIEDFKTKLDDAEEELDNLEQKVFQLDFEQIERALDSQKTTVDDFETKNQEFKNQLISFKSSFDDLKDELKNLEETIAPYEQETNLLLNTVNSMISTTDDLLEEDLSHSVRDSLIEQKQQLESFKQRIQTIQQGINLITNNNSKIVQAVNQADDVFSQLEAESKNVTQTLGDSSTTIESMNEKLSVFRDSMDEVKNLIAEARKSRVEILGQLEESSEAMNTFSQQLKEFERIDPNVLAQPIVIFDRGLYKPDRIDTALYPLDTVVTGSITSSAISIVLILTCLLLTSITIILERKERVVLRMALSKTNKIIFLLGKIIGQLSVAIIEATIVLLVAIFVFGLNILPFIIEIYLAIILISIAFINMGVLIASFTKNQSTAILLSLLLIIPMLFLSGVIMPTDLMTPAMQTASSFLPLTASNAILTGVIVKGLAIQHMFVEILVMVFIILAGTMAFLLKRDY